MPPIEETDIDAVTMVMKRDGYIDKKDDNVIKSCEIFHGDFDERTSLLGEQRGRVDTQVKDRYRLVYIDAFIQGLGVFLPWQMFMCSKEYFVDYKLINAETADFRVNFFSYAGLASQIPNAILNFLNLFTESSDRGSTNFRIITSILTVTAMFFVTVAMAIIDTEGSEEMFFIVTLGTIAIINMGTGIWANCIFGVFAQFPPILLTGAMSGMQLSGALSSILMVLTKTGTTLRTASIYYFLGAAMLCLICLDMYLALPSSRYYRLYINDRATKDDRIKTYEKLPYIKTLKKVWRPLFDIWLLRVIGLCLYPSVLSSIERCDPNFFIPEKYYTDVVYVLYNVIIVFGNFVSYKFPMPTSRYMGYSVWLRFFVLIPFFYFCNYRPAARGSLPVLFNNDWLFFAGLVLHGFWNGHSSGLTVVYAKQAAGDDRLVQKTAGMMAAFVQSVGFVAGHQLTLIINIILSV